MSWRRPALLALLAVAALAAPASVAHAEGFEWLRSKNRAIERGNEKLKAGDANGALEAYDQAARELPAEGGVHLNRGLALLKQGKLDQAREALKLATEPPASSELRSDAYYDLGVAFYRQAESQLAEQQDEDAQKAFREAADAFRKSAIMKPGRRDAAWNYELAQRQVVELKKKQEQQKQQQQPQQDDPQKQDGESQDQQQPGDPQQQGDQPPEPQPEDSQGQDQPKPGDEPQPKPGDEKKDEQGQQAQQPQPKPEPKQDAQRAAQAQPAEAKQGENGQKPLPADVARALDALQSGEKNLEQQRAMQRAGQRRPPAKDW